MVKSSPNSTRLDIIICDRHLRSRWCPDSSPDPKATEMHPTNLPPVGPYLRRQRRRRRPQSVGSWQHVAQEAPTPDLAPQVTVHGLKVTGVGLGRSVGQRRPVVALRGTGQTLAGRSRRSLEETGGRLRTPGLARCVGEQSTPTPRPAGDTGTGRPADVDTGPQDRAVGGSVDETGLRRRDDPVLVEGRVGETEGPPVDAGTGPETLIAPSPPVAHGRRT